MLLLVIGVMAAALVVLTMIIVKVVEEDIS